MAVRAWAGFTHAQPSSSRSTPRTGFRFASANGVSRSADDMAAAAIKQESRRRQRGGCFVPNRSEPRQQATPAPAVGLGVLTRLHEVQLGRMTEYSEGAGVASARAGRSSWATARVGALNQVDQLLERLSTPPRR